MARVPARVVPFVLLLGSAVTAQVDRYELGLRLRDFERQLATESAATPDDAKRRDAAFAQLDRAVQAFFRLDTKTVAIAIDAASLALRGGDTLPGETPARGLQLDAGPRLVPQGQATLALCVRPAYPTGEACPPGLVVRVWIDGTADAVVEQELGDLDTTPEVTFALPIAAVPAGDHLLRWTVRRGANVLVTRWQGLSVAKDLAARLAKLEALPEANEKTLEALTLAAHRKVLGALQRKRSEETVLPGARLLDEAEAIAAAPANGRYYDAARTGQFWLRVPTGKSAETVRLFAPAAREGNGKQPIVVAMHGAGGSENLFFDGYGDGEVVRQCAQRGWFCVAPRAGLGGGADVQGLLAALATRWPIDLDRVLVVGHSMGAAMAIGTVMREPARYRAVAALGGGGNVRRGAKLDATRFFVGYGTRDFLRSSAQQLERALIDANAPLTRREYPGVEHLAIVQIALPDVFTFFDAALSPAAGSGAPR